MFLVYKESTKNEINVEKICVAVCSNFTYEDTMFIQIQHVQFHKF